MEPPPDEGRPRRDRWPYFVVPTVVLMLLGICWVESALAPKGLVARLLGDTVGMRLVSRTAEAGTPDSEGAGLPGEVREQLDIASAKEVEGRLVQTLETGEQVTYTLDPVLQSKAESLLENGALLAGAIVLVDTKTGRILALASEGEALTPEGEEPDEPRMMALSAEAPSASVFKVVTGAALLDAGVDPDDKVCYWGGGSKLELANLEDDPKKDKSCSDLGFAMGKSVNCVFAKLADRHLDEDSLEGAARDFGFGEKLPLDYSEAPEKSTFDIPGERLEFARTAAGFWHVHMSPLHGAFLAQSVAQDGAMLHPLLVEEVRDGDGEVVWKAEPRWLRRTVSKDTAEVLTSLMVNTTTRGTARKYFKDKKGNAYLPGMKVAGKTGTLTRSKPYRAYTWFVGFAPADDPEIAVAALAVNEPTWTVKGASLARDILRKWFKNRD